jgi:Protein of unknown function (DUF1353)
MKRGRIVVTMLIGLLCVSASQGGHFGHFIGNVKAQWLDDGRNMRLIDDFEYVDQNNVIWNAPKGSIVDGASIPKKYWSLIGGPFEGKYRNASVIHDVACDKKDRPWQTVHAAFFDAMMASGVDPVLASVMYAAVFYKGPRWELVVALGPTTSKEKIMEEKKEVERASGTHNKFTLLPADSDSLAHNQTQAAGQTKPHDYSPKIAAGAPFVVVVAPNEATITDADLDALKADIEKRARSPIGSMTLEEIRNYRPTK